MFAAGADLHLVVLFVQDVLDQSAGVGIVVNNQNPPCRLRQVFLLPRIWAGQSPSA